MNVEIPNYISIMLITDGKYNQFPISMIYRLAKSNMKALDTLLTKWNSTGFKTKMC